MTLTRLERETILSFNAEEASANVYSCDPTQIRRLEKRLGPGRAVGECGMEWEIPISWITLPRAKRPKSLSPEVRERLRGNIAKAQQARKA